MKIISNVIVFNVLYLFISINISIAQEKEVYNYILDYNVPESPAFVGLGVTPEKILSGSAAKPIAVNLLNQLKNAQEIERGLALDFSPFFVFGGRLETIEEYRNNSWKRILANTSLSFATIENSENTNSLRFGFGIRSTIFDSRDLLGDAELGSDIDDALSGGADADPQLGGDETPQVGSFVDLSSAYEEAKLRAESKSGHALSIGYALGGTLKNSIANRDSLDNETHNFWTSYTRYKIFTNIDLMIHYQAIISDTLNSDRIGFAFKGGNESASIAFETVWGLFYNNNVQVGGFAEVKLNPNIWLIASIVSEEPQYVLDSANQLVARTKLRWNFGK